MQKQIPDCVFYQRHEACVQLVVSISIKCWSQPRFSISLTVQYKSLLTCVQSIPYYLGSCMMHELDLYVLLLSIGLDCLLETALKIRTQEAARFRANSLSSDSLTTATDHVGRQTRGGHLYKLASIFTKKGIFMLCQWCSVEKSVGYQAIVKLLSNR